MAIERIPLDSFIKTTARAEQIFEDILLRVIFYTWILARFIICPGDDFAMIGGAFSTSAVQADDQPKKVEEYIRPPERVDFEITPPRGK